MWREPAESHPSALPKASEFCRFDMCSVFYQLDNYPSGGRSVSRNKKKMMILSVIESDSTVTSAKDVVILRIVRTICANRSCVNVSYRVNIPDDHNLSPLPSPRNVLL
jgi:hypothetical protein